MTQLSTDGAQKPEVENVRAWERPSRFMKSASPCRSFVPDFVTIFRAGPAVQPYSDEKALERTVIS